MLRDGDPCIAGRAACSLTANPVAGTPPKVHHCENAEFIADHGVQQTVRKPMAQPSAKLAANDWCRVRVIDDCFGAPLHLCDEHSPKAGPL